MDLRQLRHFTAVAETLHFGRAAERLGMTQPPLSQSIQALERELGAALFARTKRSVALTPFGAQWLPHVEAALERVNGLPEIARRLREGEAGRLELSFVSTADYSILPMLVRRYAALFPDIEIALTEATSDVQITALRDGKGHAGIIIAPADRVLPPGLAYRQLVSEPLIAAIPEAWIADGRITLVDGHVSAETVVGQPLIIFPRRVAPAFHDLVTGYHAAWRGTPRIVQEAIQMQTIISLVSAGMGISLVPASLRNLARTGVRYADLRDAPPVLETGIAWRQDYVPATLARFLDIAAETAAGQPLASASPIL
ncbi:DNA-binding transcriptional regulator, LysR family [Sphingomonas sp. OV641]|uniref:LysR family transcriptional regulator n=1 Tax=Sphingomonas sp. OV641 TaxID=1881068 RepID=UPI0008C63E0C|nr:LysR family transcriptional regulator [Sphingomonas sp. OV641]SEJ20208.1 DNA-binding transcriptional regulator, LysR family [Sphingomonas sp. OV641]